MPDTDYGVNDMGRNNASRLNDEIVLCANVKPCGWGKREGGGGKRTVALLGERSHYTLYLLPPTYHFNLHLWGRWYLLNMYWCVVSLCFILPGSFPFIWPPSAFPRLRVWNQNNSHLHFFFPCSFLQVDATFYVVIFYSSKKRLSICINQGDIRKVRNDLLWNCRCRNTWKPALVSAIINNHGCSTHNTYVNLFFHCFTSFCP